MKEISVGVILTPLSAKDWDLKEISAGIIGKRQLEEVHSPDNYYVWFSSIDGKAEVGIYFDGMVYYVKKVREEDVTRTQMLDIVKEAFAFIQDLPLDRDYSRRVGLVMRGKHMKAFYARKQRVVEEFGAKLFNRPLFGQIEVTDCDVQISIRETPLLSFASM